MTGSHGIHCSRSISPPIRYPGLSARGFEYRSHHRWQLVREGQHGARGVEKLHDLRAQRELGAVVPLGVVQQHVDVEEALEYCVGERDGDVGPREVEPSVGAVSVPHCSGHLLHSLEPRLHSAQMEHSI